MKSLKDFSHKKQNFNRKAELKVKLSHSNKNSISEIKGDSKNKRKQFSSNLSERLVQKQVKLKILKISHKFAKI